MSNQIQEILTEWTYRLPKGYPVEVKDYDVLQEILDEMTDLPAAQKENIIRQARGLTEAPGDDESEELDTTDTQHINNRFTELNLSSNITEYLQQEYDSLSESEKRKFDDNYRKHTIDSYTEGGYNAFKKFYWVTDHSKAAGGLGRGEIQTLLAVADSKTGGTSQHDIVLPTGEWEIKEVGTVGKSQKTFRPAAAGMTQQGDLLSKIQDFFNDIIIPFSQMPDAYETLKDVVNEHSWPRLQDFISILNKSFIPLIPSVTKGREISYKSGWQTMYTAFKQLHDIFWKTEFDTDIQDTRLSIKSDDKQTSYWISNDDYDKIEKHAGNQDPVDIHIGNPISSPENSNSVIWFKRIKRSTFIATPDAMIFQLNEIKNRFFADILGLIIFDVYRPGVPIKSPASDWSIVGVSQGMWVFGLKTTYDDKYTIIQLQS
jgi:hypothetical protein